MNGLQQDEREAVRKWRTVEDRINEFNAYGLPSGYRPRTETEKALLDSLKEMQLQAKERIGLLDALRQSRVDSNPNAPGSQYESLRATGRGSNFSRTSSAQDQNWMGEGTVRPVDYSELPRPGPSLPPRPQAQRNQGSEASVRALGSSSTHLTPSVSPSPYAKPSLPVQPRRASRTPSPTKEERKGGLRMTLRDGRDKKRDSKSRTSGQRKDGGVAAAKAASQAWTSKPSFGSGHLGQSLLGQSDSSATINSFQTPQRASFSQPSSTQATPGDESPDSFRKYSSDFDSFSPSHFGADESRATSSTNAPRVNLYDPSYNSPTKINSSYFSDGKTSPAPGLGSVAGIENKGGLLTKHRPPSPPRHSKPTMPNPLPPMAKTLDPLPSKPPVPPHRGPQPNGRSNRPTPSERTDSDRRRVSSTSEENTTTKLTRKPVGTSGGPRASASGKPYLDMPPNDMEHQDRKESAITGRRSVRKTKKLEDPIGVAALSTPQSSGSDVPNLGEADMEWQNRVTDLMKNLPKGIDEQAAKQIFNEIVVQGDEVHWDDVAGLDIAKNALKEAVVYPFLRPDLFMGLREPARGMLLFGPPGTGKTMLARAVATESKSTFFSISASSLTSKFLGDSEKLVRALFAIAKALAPSIIFVDEIDSLLSTRSSSGEHEATRRIKTEFLIQWSDLQRAAAGSKQSAKDIERGDASRVLVLAATNLPWAIDEAARRRFVRRQYIPLPEDNVRAQQLRTLIGHQKHELNESNIAELVRLTDGIYHD